MVHLYFIHVWGWRWPGSRRVCSWWADLDYANVLYFAFLLFCSMWMFKVRVDFAEVVNSRYYFSCQRRNRNRTEALSSPSPPHFPIHPMVTRWRSNIIHTHSHLALNCSSCERQFVCFNQLFRTSDFFFFHVSCSKQETWNSLLLSPTVKDMTHLANWEFYAGSKCQCLWEEMVVVDCGRVVNLRIVRGVTRLCLLQQQLRPWKQKWY